MKTVLLAIFISALVFPASLLAVQPSEVFSRLPKYQSPKLSSSGTKIAVTINTQADGKHFAILSVLDALKTRYKYLVKTDNESVKINWYSWANDRTLLVSIVYAGRRYQEDTAETRLFAVDVDQENPQMRLLVKPRRGRRAQHISQLQDRVIDYLPDDESHVLIALDLDSANQPSVYKLNIYDKKLTRVEKGKRRIRSWNDRSTGKFAARCLHELHQCCPQNQCA